MQLNRFSFNYKIQKEFIFFLCSDLHLDSPLFDSEKLSKDLTKAKKLNAKIIINGDIFSAIKKSDPRHSRSYDRNERQDKTSYDIIEF